MFFDLWLFLFFSCLRIPASFFRTIDLCLLRQERPTVVRAFLRRRQIPERLVTVRITVAGIERLSFFGSFDDDVAFFALGTHHARFLFYVLDMFAFRVA